MGSGGRQGIRGKSWLHAGVDLQLRTSSNVRSYNLNAKSLASTCSGFFLGFFFFGLLTKIIFLFPPRDFGRFFRRVFLGGILLPLLNSTRFLWNVV